MSRRITKRQPDFPALKSPTPSASIILVTYHTAEHYIEQCMAALRKLDYPNYEIIWVDNASRPETREALKRHCADARVIYNTRNRGFAGGCNDGAAVARGDVLVFLNADTEVEPDWLREIVLPITRDPRIAITGCKMFFADKIRLQHAGGVMHANAMTEHFGYGQPDDGQFDREADMDYVTGAGLAARREYMQLCGGFDEDYYPAYFEELDLCYRARRMGYRVVYAPKARLVHYESPFAGGQLENFQRLYYYARMIFCIKNYRLRDWLFRFLPREIGWLRSPDSKGCRKKQIPAYLGGIAYLLGRRYSPERPFPRVGS